MTARSSQMAILLAFASGAAMAAEPKVRVNAEIVLASNNGNTVDPPALAHMKNQFTRGGFAFTSYRRLSSEKLSLKRDPVELKLPNQRTATLRLDAMKSGVATVRVDISNLSSTTLTMGREGSLFQYAGEHEGGQLILVLSPDHTGQPRHLASGISRPAEAVARQLTGDVESEPLAH